MKEILNIILTLLYSGGFVFALSKKRYLFAYVYLIFALFTTCGLARADEPRAYLCTCNAGTQHEYSVSIPDYGCAPERDAPRLLKDAVKEMYESDRYLTPRERRAETRKELKRCSCVWVEK